MGAEFQSPESWKGFRAWIPQARLFLEAERHACHREMSHAEGEGLMDFSTVAAIYQGTSLDHRTQNVKGGMGF